MALRTLFTLALSSASLAAPSAVPTAPPRGQVEPPPGTVHVDGGRTKIGTEVKEIEELIAQDIQAQERGNSLLAETPRHSVKLDPFFLMVNEVTNEQYEAFVRATGHQPPQSWATPEAENAARAAFLEADAKRRQEAKEAGEKVERRTFDKGRWWDDSWESSEWGVAAGAEYMPVVFVSYEDAEAYARWAGLRLMTEFEYTRAVRGDGEDAFPWGATFAEGRAATSELPGGHSEPFPVGSFQDGERGGIHDLAGNVWEWTSSPYTSFPGYKPIKVTVGRGKQAVEKSFNSAWDADARVCVSGSIQNSKMAARATARRRLERIQRTNLCGFRCAADPRVGQNIAQTILDRDLPRSVRPSTEDGKVEYRPEIVIAYDCWETSGAAPAKGEAKDALAAKDADAEPREATAKKATVPPPGYAVIEDYDYALFIPASAARTASQTSLRKETVDGQPLALGVLSTTYPILNPALDAGTYMVGFRGAGKRKERRDKQPAETPDPNDPAAQDPAASGQAPAQEEEPTDEHAWEAELGLDPEVDTFVFYDKKGAPIALLPCPENDWDYTRMNPGTIDVIEVEIVEGEGKEKVVRKEKRLQFEVMLEGLTSSKGFRFKLPLEMDATFFEKDWRKQD